MISLNLKFLFILCLSFLLALPAALATPADLRPWESIVVQDSGRRKPIGTFGHEALVKIAGKDPIIGPNEQVYNGNAFLFSTIFATQDWKDVPLIFINYKPLGEKLGLDSTQKRFPASKLAHARELVALSQEAAALRQANKPVPRLNAEAQTVLGRLQLFDSLVSTSGFLLAPPPPSAPAGAPWLAIDQMATVYPAEDSSKIIEDLRALNTSAKNNDSTAFAEAASRLETNLRALNPKVYPDHEHIQRELLYNRLNPFNLAMWLLIPAALFLFIGADSGFRRWFSRIGVVFSLISLGMMIAGITLRVFIAGRAPVTNMFESVVWVSMGTLLFGLIFYSIYRNRPMLLSAIPISFLCLLLVRSLPVAMPMRLDPLVPVLRDNFWLTTHVLTITLSYAAFALTLGFAHVVLWQYIRNPLAADKMKYLHAWLYRMMFVGVILLAAGIILGGVWANYSWGRFWGWDPKETWALIALLMYILAMHGKMAGWWGDFGIAIAAVLGFSGIIMAWYGVNYVLGTGLHSYGFGVGGEGYVLTFLGIEAAYVALAFTRRHRALRAVHSPSA